MMASSSAMPHSSPALSRRITSLSSWAPEQSLNLILKARRKASDSLCIAASIAPQALHTDAQISRGMLCTYVLDLGMH